MCSNTVACHTFTMTSMSDIMPKISKDFQFLCHAKEVTYDTPHGRFTVKLQILSESFEKIDLVAKIALSNCKCCTIEVRVPMQAKFGTSSMKMDFQSDFSDADTIAKVKSFVEEHNQKFKTEQIFFPTADQNNFDGFLRNGQYHPYNRP